MKETIKALIADGWEWGTRNKDATIRIFRGSKPFFVEERGVFENKENLWLQIPSCLFPEITFETSPIELKTLLVDAEKEEQDFIRQKLIADKDAYIIREWDNNTKLILVCDYGTGKTALFCKELEKYLSTEKIHEKVYLKDLIKKRKVKKSVWFSVDIDGHKNLSFDKPTRANGCNYWVGTKLGDCLYNRERDNGDGSLYLTWEDEPIELFYEVEE